MSEKIDWIAVHSHGNRLIGAVGFLGNTAVAVVAFYDDRDANMDGKVSIGERAIAMLSPISLSGRMVNQVAQQARVNPDIINRDPEFGSIAMNMFVNFARGLVLQGVYTVYFSRGVSMAGSGVAKMITSSMVKQFVIRKGFEVAVAKAFDKAVNAY